MNKLTDSFVLSNGVKVPCVGYGTYLTPIDVPLYAFGRRKHLQLPLSTAIETKKPP